MISKIYHSFNSKVWKFIEKKYFAESSKAYKVLKRFKLLYSANIQLKKTKLLIIFSIIIGSIAAIDESIVLYSLFKSSIALSFSENLEKTIKILFLNIIPIVGFIGSLYLLIRRSVGLWLIAIWCSLLIIPIYISFSENGFILSQNYLNFFNMSPLVHGVVAGSQSITEMNGTDYLYQEVDGTDYLYQVKFQIKYSPYTSGVGCNFVPIIYLIIIMFLAYQNKKLFTYKKLILFISVVLISGILPFAIYSYFNYVHEKNSLKFEHRKIDLLRSANYTSIVQHSFAERCYSFSRLYFKADDNQLIKEVSCYNGNEVITHTE